MPTTNDTVMELEHLQTAITKNADLVPGTERFRVPLDEAIQEIRALMGSQKTLIADKQKVTQDLKAAVDAAKTLAINIRAIAKGDVGSRSEKLVEFGVAPLRPRSRKRKGQETPDGEPVSPPKPAPEA